MTTMTIASGLLFGGGDDGTQSFFEESLDPARIQSAMFRAFKTPQQPHADEDPNILLARMMIAHQDRISKTTEDQTDWFSIATGVFSSLGSLGSVLGSALMFAGRGLIRMMLGVTTFLVRTLVRLAWVGIRGVFQLLIPFITGFPLVAAAIAASIGGYLAYRHLKNKDIIAQGGLSGALGSVGSTLPPRTVSTTGQDLGLEQARATGADFTGTSSTKVSAPPKLPPEVVALANATADRYGIPRGEFLAFIAVESGGKNVSRGEKGAKGLLQFIPSTAKMYGIEGKEMDMALNLDAGARLYLDNAKFLKGKGIAPTVTNIYLAHQQGAGAVKTLLNAAAAGLRVSELPDRLRKNVRNNMYGKSEFVSEYVGSTRKKLTTWANAYAGNVGSPSSSTQVAPPTTPSGEQAAKKAVDSQVKPPDKTPAAAATPAPAQKTEKAPDPIRLPNGVLVDAAN